MKALNDTIRNKLLDTQLFTLIDELIERGYSRKAAFEIAENIINKTSDILT